ncbi:hypothetical protein [Sphingomonas sp. CROZ-RG-20F-R02-07]|uniref:hypothetical protein n=1 Tax=Sphingomonas sp. CROZ-RG-20F-R02-07 TaxID=2914832 RepID=UPI001F5AAF0C|nr:hypothetical protein [Sphingomonas sp. CROZ-RG-20F-R02-07]
MTIAAILLTLQAVLPQASAAPAAQAPFPAMLAPPQDWSRLPPLMLRRPVAQAPEAAAYVASEIAAGRCTWTGTMLTVDFAVLASPAGQVKRIVPRAIGCPTVEQYAAGILLSMARSNIDTGSAGGEGWYRTTLSFTWGP